MPSSIIQFVLVPKSKFKRDEAIKYVRQHHIYKKTDSNRRYRQQTVAYLHFLPASEILQCDC